MVSAMNTYCKDLLCGVRYNYWLSVQSFTTNAENESEVGQKLEGEHGAWGWGGLIISNWPEPTAGEHSLIALNYSHAYCDQRGDVN